MADKKLSLPSLDQLKNSPAYNQILQQINDNPEEAFKELTIMSETDNPISQANGGLGLINDLKSHVNISQSQVDNMFQPAEIPDELKQSIDDDPATIYQQIYNTYAYDPNVDKTAARSVLSGAKQYLYDKGVNPDDYLTKSPFWQGLEAVANTVMVPTNLLAKAFAKDPDKVKIWGGNGWEDTLRQYGMNPEIQALVKKREANIPVVGDDAKKLQDFDNKYGILGFIGNIVADPTIILGAVGKGAGLVAKGLGETSTLGKAIGTVGKVFDVISNPLQELANAKRVANFVPTGEFNNVLKETLTAGKAVLGDDHPLVPLINDALRNPEADKSAIGLVDDTASALKAQGQHDVANQFEKAASNMRDTLSKSESLNQSKGFNKVLMVDKKLNNMIENFKEKSGIRKLFVSDVPMKVKDTMDAGRRIRIGMDREVAQSQQNIAKNIKPLKQLFEKDSVMKADLAQKGMTPDDAIFDMIEKPSNWPTYKNIMDNNPAFKEARQSMNDYILTEAKYAGSKIQPLNNVDPMWNKLADQYKDLWKVNPYNPDLAEIKNGLNDILNKSNGIKLMDNGVMEAFGDNIAYFTHARTKEANDIANKLPGNIRNSMGQHMASYTANKSFLARENIFKDTAVNINKKISDGSIMNNVDSELNKLTQIKNNGAQYIRDMAAKDSNDVFTAIENSIRDRFMVTNADSILGSLHGLRDIVNNDVGKYAEILFKNKKSGIRDATTYLKSRMKQYEKLFQDNIVSKIDVKPISPLAPVIKDATQQIVKPDMEQFKQVFKNIFQNTKDVVKSTNKENLIKLDNEIKTLSGMKSWLPAYKGVKFFDTDIGKIIGIRGARTSKTVEQSVMYDGLKQFGKDTKESGFVKPNLGVGKIIGIRGARTSKTVEQSGLKQFGKDTKESGFVKPNLGGRNIAGLSDMYFEPDIAHAIERIWSYTKDDRATKVLLNTLEDFQNFWKAMTLSTHVATPIRNFLGHIFLSLLVVDKPRYLLQSVKDVFMHQIGKDYNIVTDSGKVISVSKIFQEGRQRGMEATTFRNIDINRNERGVAQSFTGKAMEGVGNAFHNASNWLKQMPLAQLNNFVEGNARMATFMTKVKEGLSFDEAAKATYKAFFDYSDMTLFEKDIKKFIPFFAWARFNLPLQIGRLMSEPNKFLIKGTYMFNQNRPSNTTIDKRQMSEFLKNKINVPLYTDEKGQQKYLMLEGLLPLMDLGGALRAVVSDNRLQAIVDDMMTSISPIIKTPIEILANRNFAFKTDLRKSFGDTSEFLGFYMPPELKVLLQDWRVLATLNKGLNINPNTLGTDPKDMSRMLFTYFLGSPVPYNQFYSRIVSNRNAVQAIGGELANFHGFLSKLGTMMNGGAQPTQYDLDQVTGRVKGLIMAINKDYVDGALDDKQRGNYFTQLLSDFIPMQMQRGGGKFGIVNPKANLHLPHKPRLPSFGMKKMHGSSGLNMKTGNIKMPR